jgi:two-component system sensor histidine kinase PilS (NtrC family)
MSVVVAEPAASVPSGAEARPDAPALFGSRRRLTYLMLFRVVVVTLLLGATLVSELGSLEQPVSTVSAVVFGLIAATYGLTIVYALLLRRNARPEPLLAAQICTDLALTTALVHFTGGVESVFAFMYILIIVAASLMNPRAALVTAGGAVLLYAGALGLWWEPAMPLRTLLRALSINAVAFAATGVLAARLAVELKRAGERLAHQGVMLRDLAALHEDVIRCLTSGLVTLSDEQRVITLNAAAREILGVDDSRAIGREIDEVMPGMRALLRSAGAEPLRRAELKLGSRTLGVSLSPLVDSSGNTLGRVINFQDLTDLRRMEEAMVRAERLAAVGRLAAGIAHEIRNPLAAISGSIELLSQTGLGDGAAESRELMAIVLREVARLDSLIRELLEFARPRPPEPQPLELAATVGEMVRVFENDRRLHSSPVELHAPTPVIVDADPAQVRQLLWNLLRNAAEASPRGAPISVDVDSEDLDGHKWARLVVRDRGPGIPAEQRARVFEPFFSTKEGGTGLGLATVHRIVEEHRGRIEIADPPGGGAAVIVRLTLHAAT